MRWSRMLAQLKHPHSASLSFASLNFCSASISTLARRKSPQENPRPGQESDTPSHASSSATVKTGTASSLQGKASSSPSQTASITSSSRTVATSHTIARPFARSSTEGEKARLSASDDVKLIGRRREALAQVNIKPLEISSGKAKASTKPSSTGENKASSLNHAEKGSVAISKNSRIAFNQRNGEALTVDRKTSGNINYAADGTRIIQTSPSYKAGPRARSNGSPLLYTENVSTTPLGERTLDEKLESSSSDVSMGDEEITASSAKDIRACALGTSPSEGSTGLDDKDQAGSKKLPFAASFPVKVLCDWWFSCYSQARRPYYTTLTHPFNKIYLWLAAYQRAHFDVTGHYANGQSAEILREQLVRLLNDVLDGKFQWADKKVLYLPMPVSQNEEPLPNVRNSPSFQDRVVNEVLYLVLEPIFEARFSGRSHGFRPERDARTALRAAQRCFLGCTWFIRGDLSVLHIDKHANLLVESALRVVRDAKITFLLKSGFLGGMREQQGSTRACMFSDQGSYSKLRNLLCNVFLDQLDSFMDEQISGISTREQLSIRSSLNSLFKPEKVRVEKPRKLEYIRFGTDVLLACNGTREEAELVQNSINSYFKEKFSMDVGKRFTISHISDGIEFLDHIISQKIVHPIVSRRTASSGTVCEKRAHRIRLCVNASRDRCVQYLKQIETPTSLQHIEEMLVVLDSWYHCAENRNKVMEYCKLTLCHNFAKGVIENCKEGSVNLDAKVKEAMHMVGDQRKLGNSDKENTTQDFFWVPEHEYCLRDHVWLQSQTAAKVVANFKKLRIVFPQQYMPQILWRFLGDAYSSNGDSSGEPDVLMPLGQGYLADTKLEDFAESTG